MAYEKIPLEKWKTLTKEEQDYHTLQFQQAVERRKKLTIIATRVIAVIFIGVLFYMGYVQLQSVKNYNEKLDKYGTMGFCALCGEYNLKKCECQYARTYDTAGNYLGQPNRTKMSNELADYNSQFCQSYEEYHEQEIKNLTQILGSLK